MRSVEAIRSDGVTFATPCPPLAYSRWTRLPWWGSNNSRTSSIVMQPFLVRDRLTDRFHERGFAGAGVSHDGNILFRQHRRVNEQTQLAIASDTATNCRSTGSRSAASTVQRRSTLRPDIAAEGAFRLILIK